jgi:hypothetical protein
MREDAAALTLGAGRGLRMVAAEPLNTLANIASSPLMGIAVVMLSGVSGDPVKVFEAFGKWFLLRAALGVAQNSLNRLPRAAAVAAIVPGVVF